jgi:hypothetical protein
MTFKSAIKAVQSNMAQTNKAINTAKPESSILVTMMEKIPLNVHSGAGSET